MPRALSIGLSIALLSACGGVAQIERADDEDREYVAYSFQQNPTALCTVRVSGSYSGTKDVETDYLPRVLKCEVGGEALIDQAQREGSGSVAWQQALEMLKANAIAERTFLYYVIKALGRGSIRNSTNDQVYRVGYCSGTPSQLLKDAVAATRGMVMVKQGGSLHSGYYRHGKSNSCSAYGTCYSQPCMGQIESQACAKQGYGYQQILAKYFNNPTIVAATGTCTGGDGGVVPDASGACFYAGVRGDCKDPGEACGVKKAAPCAEGKQCCLASADPDAVHYGKACSGGTGSCRSRANFACPGDSWVQNQCLGGADAQCCLTAQAETPIAPPPPPPTSTDAPYYGRACTSGGLNGQCQSHQSYSCPNDNWKQNACLGSPDVQCCIYADAPVQPPPTGDWGSCAYGGKTFGCAKIGDCQGGKSEPGYCPGKPTDVQCCVKFDGGPYGNCQYGGSTFSCLHTGAGCAGGEFKTGLCKGLPTNVKCCVTGGPF